MEAEIVEAWGELFYKGEISDEEIARGEEILESLRPESPLRRRLGDELSELCRLREEAARKAAEPPPRPKPVTKAPPKPAPAKPAPSETSPSQAATVAPTAPGSSDVTAPAVNAGPVFVDTDSTEEMLAKLARGEISIEDASQQLAASEKRREGLYCRVSIKGAISVYGLQRMPVTLYVEQWDRLLNFAEDIRDFARENSNELKRKA